MSDVTQVGQNLSVEARVSPDATAGFDLVVLVAAENQHVGCDFPEGVEVLRRPMIDRDEEPSAKELKAAIDAAERAAFAMAPYAVPWELSKRLMPKPSWNGSVQVPASRKVQVDLTLPIPVDEVWKSKRVLVTCEHGLDRSCWVAGMALVLAGEQPTGKDALDHLRKVRGDDALENPFMARHLRKFYPRELAAMRPKSLRAASSRA
jgi:hypothetical protein